MLAGAGAAGRDKWRAGRRGGWRGMSQSAARLQLRKPLVFTFLLKEIVGLALRALEPGQPHRGRGSFITHNELGHRAGGWGGVQRVSIH